MGGTRASCAGLGVSPLTSRGRCPGTAWRGSAPDENAAGRTSDLLSKALSVRNARAEGVRTVCVCWAGADETQPRLRAGACVWLTPRHGDPGWVAVDSKRRPFHSQVTKSEEETIGARPLSQTAVLDPPSASSSVGAGRLGRKAF